MALHRHDDRSSRRFSVLLRKQHSSMSTSNRATPMRVGAALPFPIVCMRTQSPYQFAEHCYGVIGQLLCKLDGLGDDSRPTARNRCNVVSLTNHLVPALWMNPVLKLGIDL
jgi:hypothetical protein